MIDLKHIVADAAAGFRNGGLYGGAGSLTVWRGVFRAMRAGLKDAGASPEQCQAFMNTIGLAIDNAHKNELKDDERAALRAVLSSAFDGISRPLPQALAPKAIFLSHVRF
jgi:hypothetical protein